MKEIAVKEIWHGHAYAEVGVVHQTGKWYSLDNGEAWNLVNENLVKEIEPNDKHGNLNHFLEMNEMNEYDMMDYEQRLVIDKFKIFDGAWFLDNIDYKLGFAHCLDYIDLKIFEHHYMNNYVDTVFNGWQCLVKYVFKVSIFILRFFLYMVDKVMAMWYSGLAQLAAMCLCSFSWTRSTSRAMASMALSWMASMPMALAENRDKSEGSLGVKPILLMVDSWTRYAHAEPIKPKNAKTVGSAISKFVGSLGYVGAAEVCGDNENVLVSGMEFSSMSELVRALARRSRPIATTARIALAFVNKQFRLSAICRRYW